MSSSKAVSNLKDTINIFGRSEVEYWIGKWNITEEELRNAIHDTGSFRITDIETRLRELNIIDKTSER